jgi:hypothetical protein
LPFDIGHWIRKQESTNGRPQTDAENGSLAEKPFDVNCFFPIKDIIHDPVREGSGTGDRVATRWEGIA